jgi:hypothetical protein
MIEAKAIRLRTKAEGAMAGLSDLWMQWQRFPMAHLAREL